MNFKKILVVFLLFITSASIVVAHRRAQHKPEVELTDDDEEHSEFEAQFFRHTLSLWRIKSQGF